MTDELTDALEVMIAAARRHLEEVRAAEGRVDDESVWRAYVAFNNSAYEYDELLRTTFDEVTPFDLEPLRTDDLDTDSDGEPSVEEAVEPDPEPAVISVRQRRDYLVPSSAALLRAAELAREQVPDPDGDDQPIQGIGDAVLELLHAGDGTLHSLEVPELTPLDGIVVVNDVSEGLDVAATDDGHEDLAFEVSPADAMIGRLDERSFHSGVEAGVTVRADD
ncbi:hypothetical protein LX16_1131 [Stackebrandtia albiflava]|uniref:Uncharacterized protein n=1 Tax=Stackebrandtia albiflava TaxID=406432 RepID=A0A562VC29_9ACTN|nr:hypothetical protein [Stackebrandtia albiflava]TWJ15426.1 hypothetical protein LX16_1131 [Stackebrandtia albiflava]